MRPTLLIFIFIVFFALNVPAQLSPGARQIALSNSGIAQSDDVFALFSNPAGLSQLTWREIGIFYSPAPFGLSELSNGFAAYHEPTKFGSLAAGYMTYGFDLYRESKIAIGYSNSISRQLFFGMSLIYNNVSIKNYGDDSAISFLFGGLAYLKEQFRVGFAIDNISRASYGDDEEQIPLSFSSGLSYDLIENITLNTAVIKEIDFPASFRFGLEYSLIEYLSIRFGVGNEPARYSAGIGINYSVFALDYAVFSHNNLGFTHQFGLLISFDRDKPRKESIKSNLNLKN